jgi:hypothetical protein
LKVLKLAAFEKVAGNINNILQENDRCLQGVNMAGNKLGHLQPRRAAKFGGKRQVNVFFAVSGYFQTTK